MNLFRKLSHIEYLHNKKLQCTTNCINYLFCSKHYHYLALQMMAPSVHVRKMSIL